METDYPAAHSMDTVWFAVDRDGHVALFSTGEAGAVPTHAYQEDNRVYEELERALPQGGVAYDLAGQVMPGGEEAPHWTEHFTDRPQTALAFVKSLDPLQQAIADGHAVPVPAHQGLAVILRNANKALIDKLHKSGNCLGCFFHYEPEGGNPETRGGIFHYGHLCENWISGPYGREQVPLQPVHIDQLPPTVRQAIVQMRFTSLCFAETPHIQPAEHADCTSWEVACLSSDGKSVRPIPGNEAHDDNAYREFIEEMKDEKLLEGVKIEMPPGDARKGGK